MYSMSRQKYDGFAAVLAFVAVFFFFSVRAEESVDVYNGELPGADKQAVYKSSAQWTGTVVLRNVSPTDDFHPEYYGNANSTIEFNGITPASLPKSGTFPGTVRLTDPDEGRAWTMGGGYSVTDTGYIIARLTGDGSFEDTNLDVNQQITITDGSTFTGDLTILGKRWVFGTTSVGSSGNGKITVQKGQTIAFAGQTWNAKSGVAFITEMNVIGKVGDFIIMPEPEKIPSITLKSTTGEEVAGAYVLRYTEGRLMVVEASAWDKNNLAYAMVEDAIKAYGGAAVTLAKDVEVDVAKLSAGRTFTVKRQGYEFSWRDAADKFIDVNKDGKFVVKQGQPDNGLTSYESYLLGLKPQADAGAAPDRPFLRMISSALVNGVPQTGFGFFHAVNGGQIEPRTDFGKTAVLKVRYADNLEFAGGPQEAEAGSDGTVTIALPQPGEGESAVRYFKPVFDFR